MDLNNCLQIGASVTQTTLVLDQHTAPHVGSGYAKVLATPVLVNLFETAALAVIETKLPADTQSLGTRLEIEHTAATPTNMNVKVTATLIKVEGRTVTFKLMAQDEIEKVSCGIHVRVVVDKQKFDLRVIAKSKV
ncbi:MAG: fluoroacetyl-CoA thioesterase [Gammaproteobacteria bacterium]|jgi:fluoroacetyl-CoA thioesterase